CCVCNSGFSKMQCSADLSSCGLGPLMTISGQDVFAVACTEERRQEALLLVTGGNRAHGQRSTSKDAVLFGGIEQLGGDALAENHRGVQCARRGTTTEAATLSAAFMASSDTRTARGTTGGDSMCTLFSFGVQK